MSVAKRPSKGSHLTRSAIQGSAEKTREKLMKRAKAQEVVIKIRFRK